MVVARQAQLARQVPAPPEVPSRWMLADEPVTGRRVRHEVADGAAVVAFSLGTSVLLALLLGLALHLAG